MRKRNRVVNYDAREMFLKFREEISKEIGIEFNADIAARYAPMSLKRGAYGKKRKKHK